MKQIRILWLALLTLLLCSTAAFAAKPVISSDSNYLDINTGRYILEGHVRVEVNNRIITADKAQVSIASLEVWGQGNITVTQDDITFTGDSCYVSGSDKEAVISGRTKFDRTGLNIRADNAKFNWDTKIANFDDNVVLTQDGSVTNLDHLRYNVVENQIL